VGRGVAASRPGASVSEIELTEADERGRLAAGEGQILALEYEVPVLRGVQNPPAVNWSLKESRRNAEPASADNCTQFGTDNCTQFGQIDSSAAVNRLIETYTTRCEWPNWAEWPPIAGRR
jgi:hypothetical protein